jgi:hypothetical protein
MNDPCEQIQKQLTKMHLGKQSIDDDVQVLAHLNTCAQCRLHLDRLRHDFKGMRVDADSLDEYVDQFKSKVAQTTQQVQAKQTSPGQQSHGPKTTVCIACTTILIIGLYLLWPLLTGRQSDSAPVSPASDGQLRTQRSKVSNASPKETGEEKLARELLLAERLYSQRDIAGLMALLDTGLNQTKQNAAIYLANIGDRKTLQALQARAQAWDLGQGINPYAKAINRMQRKMARYTTTNETSTTPGESLTTETVNGLVHDPNNRPIAGARVYTAAQGQPISLMTDAAQAQPLTVTDASGRFSLASSASKDWLLVAHEQGVAVRATEALSSDATVTLASWASIKGDVYFDSQPIKECTLKAMSAEINGTSDYLCQSTAQTDELGQFLIKRIVPGRIALLHDSYEIAPGQTLELHINPNDQTIKGRLQLPGQTAAAWHTGFTGSIVPVQPDLRWSDVDLPEDFNEMSLDEVEQWCEGFGPDPATAALHYPLQADERGEFQISHVPGGTYALCGQLIDADSGQTPPPLLGRVWRIFKIPGFRNPRQLGRSINLGSFSLLPGHLNPGDMAPNFDLPTLGQERIRLREYRGELILLSFYSLVNLSPEDPHINELAAIQRIHGTHAQFALIGMLMSPFHPLVTKKVLEDADLNWPHALLKCRPSLPAGSTAEQMQFYNEQHLEFNVPGAQPWNILVSPDGHILEIGLHGQDLIDAIEVGLVERTRL